MKKTFKKSLCILLTVIMLMAVASPCFAANEEYPTIYVTGAQTNELLDAKGNQIYPIGADAMEIIKQAIAPCLEKFIIGFIKNDYSDYAQEFYNAMAPVYEKVKLDKNGEASDGSIPKYHWSTISVSDKKSGYGMGDYRFWYDWRLSPVTSAEELMHYIDRVTQATGKSKVQLVGRCYGANVVHAYLTLYKDHAANNVSDVAYYSSSVMGIDFMSALFSGEVKVDEQALTQFAEFYADSENIIEDPTTEILVFTILELFNQIKVLGLGTDVAEKIFDAVKYDLVPMVVRDTFGSWPSYWAMVTPELYVKARDFIFADCKDEYAKFIEKTDKYYNEVQLNIESTVRELKARGVNFYNFAKYGFPEYPLYAGAVQQGDSYTSLWRQSFGATSADYGKVLTDDYINAMANKKYLSPDKKVDASTSLLPDTTWYIKNMHHNTFSPLDNMTLDIMRNDYTVDSGKYPQFYNYENGQLVVQTDIDEDYNAKPDTKLSSLMKFLTAMFNFITKLFKGEISLEGIFTDK